MKKLKSFRITLLSSLLVCFTLPAQAALIDFSYVYNVQAEFETTTLTPAFVTDSPPGFFSLGPTTSAFKQTGAGSNVNIIEASVALAFQANGAGYSILGSTFANGLRGDGLSPLVSPAADLAEAYLAFSFTLQEDYAYTLFAASNLAGDFPGASATSVGGNLPITTGSGILAAGTYSFGGGGLAASVFNLQGNATGSYTYSLELQPAAVPVPAAVWLMGSALIGLVGVCRRKV